jgi:hypothetical protein
VHGRLRTRRLITNTRWPSGQTRPKQMNKATDYERYLTEDGEIDEDLVREDLARPEWQVEADIQQEVEHRLSCERELLNDDGSITIVPDDELKQMRDSIEEEVRSEIEEAEEELLRMRLN